MISKLSINGKIKIKRYVKNKLVDIFDFDNLLTDAGFSYFQGLFKGQYDPINKLGLGDGNTTASVLDVSLQNRLILLDVTYNTLFSKEIQFLATVPEGSFGSTVNFQEGGLIYKTTSEEILVSRLVFPQVVYQTTDSSLSISYSLLFS
jgi:hypothetical protein